MDNDVIEKRQKMKNTVFFGNGFNRSKNGMFSWEDLLNELASPEKGFSNEFPNTMHYEYAVMKKLNNVIDLKEKEENIKQQIANKMQKIEVNEMYEKLSRLNVENLITTNYDCTLKNTFLKNGCEHFTANTESIYSIRRNTVIVNKKMNKTYKIWNIHGEIEAPKSIMLGLDHYCGSIGKIDDYIKGKYKFQTGNENIDVSAISEKINNESKEKYDKYSWIELFFNSNIFIIGFGLDYSETDLWWILNQRVRMKNSSEFAGKINNNITFYDEVDYDKRRLLESFGVEVIGKEVNQDWTDFYESKIEDIDKLCTQDCLV
ncbi:MAG TPA: SIR2 family protein [Anaerovoracaceae bacterium]|nr:SIR2 family protein [Anaerovoracaceae bacterium]